MALQFVMEAEPTEQSGSPKPNRVIGVFQRAETIVLAVLLFAMVLIQVIELLGRFVNTGIPGALDYLQHLTLWVAFIGAMAATRFDKHIKIGNIIEWLPEKARKWATLYGFGVSAAVCACLAWAGVRLVLAEAPAAPEWLAKFVPENLAEELFLFEDGGLTKVGGLIPIWIAEAVIPIGFLVMAVRFILFSSPHWKDRLVVSIGLPFVLLLGYQGPELIAKLVWPGMIALLIGAVFGAPIFIFLGGAALLLFCKDWEPIAAIPSATYEIVVSPIFPTIPIFTLLGFILSESKASERLAKVFSTLFGWMPGGTAVSATLVCAFFTTFTGASGVTILALGGLLLPVLIKNRYSESFSVGLLTSNGSMGLLLPPSLVVILYAISAQQPIPDMFVAAFAPGILILLAVVGLCVVQGIRSDVEREPFNGKEAWQAVRGAAWEIAIPVIVLYLFFSGTCTLVETGAIAAIYALIVEVFIYRDLNLKGIYNMLVKCGTLVGGVLIILGVAKGLSSYLIDAMIADIAAEWVEQHIHSRWTFLLALNVALILVGCLMDIYSALFVVVPLLLPMAAVYGIHPAHLGAIFLANLQLGYLTPPIGMNLFLGSFRFERPLMRVARDSLPFLLLMAVMVLLITYFPFLTVGVMSLFAK